MSDLQSKVEKAFKDNASELKKLNDKLNNIVDLEYEVSDVSNNLKSASSGLKKLANKHSNYIEGLDEFNENLKQLISKISEFEPDVIQKQLGDLEKALDKIKSLIREENTIIKSKIDRNAVILVTSTILLGLAIYLS